MQKGKNKIPRSRLILAFDIEKAGQRASDPILALGAIVMDQNFNEIDSLFLPCYFPNDTKFDQKCWDEFWSTKSDLLNKIKYEGPMTQHDRIRDVIKSFQEFRARWETFALRNNIDYYFVSDTNVNDAEAINQAIHNYFPDDMPIPFSASKKEYSDFINVSDFQRGFLMAIDPNFNGQWGMTQRIIDLFEVPPRARKVDHNPVNDAYGIAYDFNVLLGIKNKRIVPKNTSNKIIRKVRTTRATDNVSIFNVVGYTMAFAALGYYVYSKWH